MNINIINIRSRDKAQGAYVYCGRGSALGNPYVMQGSSQAERDRVCEEYRKYFNRKVRIEKDGKMLEQLRTIWKLARSNTQVSLGCYCAPARCHCETIRDFVLEHDPKSEAARCTTCGHTLNHCTCGSEDQHDALNDEFYSINNPSNPEQQAEESLNSPSK